MNVSRLYLVIGAVLVAVVVIVLFLSEDQKPQAQAAEGMPPGHPDVAGQGMGEGQPGKMNVRQDFVQQLEMLRKKVDAAPAGDTTHVLALARMLGDAHQKEQAIPYFERFLKVAPKNTDALLDLSVCYFEVGKPDKSMELTQRILAIEPRNTMALYNVGAIHASQGRKAEARTAWNLLITKAPKSEDAERAKEMLLHLDEIPTKK